MKVGRPHLFSSFRRTPVKTYIDNIGAGFIAQNDVNNSKTKHIDIRYHLVRDWIAKGTIE
eukprot:5772306-Pyramimonas_sp.AAC.1